MSLELSIFSDFSEDEIQTICSYGAAHSFPKGAVVITEGDRSDSFYVIKTGRVKVYVSDEDGHEVILNTQGPGEFFGELALIDKAPRSASVATVEKSKLVMVSQAQFERWMKEHSELVFNLMRPLVRRVRALTRNVKNLALLDVYGRVAGLLTEMASAHGDSQIIEQRITHQEIANTVGASREMVSRIMRDLELGGYLQKTAGGLQIARQLPKSW